MQKSHSCCWENDDRYSAGAHADKEGFAPLPQLCVLRCTAAPAQDAQADAGQVIILPKEITRIPIVIPIAITVAITISTLFRTRIGFAA